MPVLLYVQNLAFVGRRAENGTHLEEEDVDMYLLRQQFQSQVLSNSQRACHGRTSGGDQARALYGRSSDTRPVGARREDIGNTGVRGVGGGSHSLRPHGEQSCSPLLNDHAGGGSTDNDGA